VRKYKNTADVNAVRYSRKRRTWGSTLLESVELVGGILVDLVVLDKAVDAEGRNDAHGSNHDNLDNFSHKKPPAVVFTIKYLFSDEMQAYFL
jgi:hypothetical protein